MTRFLRAYQKRLVLLYWVTVAFGTLVQHTFDLPETVFSNKRNPLNMIFVKLGWVSSFCSGMGYAETHLLIDVGGRTAAALHAFGFKALRR